MGLILYRTNLTAPAGGPCAWRCARHRGRTVTGRSVGARRRGGFLLIELITGLAILVMLLAVVASVTSSFERASAVSLARHHAWLAAQGRLEDMRAGLAPVENSDISDDDGHRVVVVVDDAPGVWAPLKLVVVTAETYAGHNRIVRVTVRGCVAPPSAAMETRP